MSDAFYCSARSRETGEQLFGTASTGQVWFLLEYPKPWGGQPQENVGLPAEVRAYLASALGMIPQSRLILISQDNTHRKPIRFFMAVTSELNPQLYKFELESYENLRDVDFSAALVDGSCSAMEEVREPLFLVCTDGKHDKCCAKQGMPVYSHLRQYGGSAVWQASHIGGDRFAANVVCFPHGVFYGHVEQEDLPNILRYGQEHSIYMGRYRGRSCYPFFIQAAEYFVRSETGITDLTSLQLLGAKTKGENTWQVSFALSGESVHEVLLSRYQSEFTARLRCNAITNKPVPQYKLLGFETHRNPTLTRHEQTTKGGLRISIRPYLPWDLADIIRVEQKSFTTDAFSANAFQGWYSKCPDLFFVVEVGGEIIGYMITCHRHDQGEIASLAIAPSHRQQGIASALVSYTLSQLKSAGARSVVLRVRESNTAGIQFWNKCGFSKTGMIVGFYRDHADAIHMTRDLARMS